MSKAIEAGLLDPDSKIPNPWLVSRLHADPRMGWEVRAPARRPYC